MINQAETERLRFVEERDGKDEALAFAKQTMAIYRQAVLNKNHFGSTRTYRQRFIEGYLSF
ncbi:MAG: hypothetical protein DRH08_05850 [Deltaproteobacteria bacterium]|nr:MAG: hypothetical protein DRH08_05850 [Deltaproteobacteria bacterium]